MTFVAYNEYGDLVAEASSMDKLLDQIEFLGYEEDEVFIGRLT